MGDYSPRFRQGKTLTFRMTTDVVGGQVLLITGDYSAGVGAAGSTKVAGIAGHDAKVGDLVPVESGGVQRPVALGAIAAGDRVAVAANGKVATATDAATTIGTALAAAADGVPADIRFDV